MLLALKAVSSEIRTSAGEDAYQDVPDVDALGGFELTCGAGVLIALCFSLVLRCHACEGKKRLSGCRVASEFRLMAGKPLQCWVVRKSAWLKEQCPKLVYLSSKVGVEQRSASVSASARFKLHTQYDHDASHGASGVRRFKEASGRDCGARGANLNRAHAWRVWHLHLQCQ